MKKWFFNKSNIVTLALVFFVLWKQGPLWVQNSQMDGIVLQTKAYTLVIAQGNQQKIQFPPKGHALIIFWATWCGPCKVEMARLKSSVEKGKISEQSLYAINPFEPPTVIRQFLSQNNYPFVFIDAPDIAEQLKVQATPTSVFLKDSVVQSVSTGMSIWGIWKAETIL